MRFFVGLRPVQGACQVWEVDDHCSEPLHPRLDLHRHSPTGFEWGYSGSGPAQLALAMLAAVTGDDDATEKLYQRFKLQVIGALPRPGWVMHAALVEEWIIAQIGGRPKVKASEVIELGEFGAAPSPD